MGHCGRDEQGTLYSLRKKEEGKKASRSYITISYNAENETIYQIKGRQNSAPPSELWNHVAKFIEITGAERLEETGEVSMLYEVHCNLELDGFEDMDDSGEATGVKLPYIVTIDVNSSEILSIRRNFLEQDPLKNKVEYFVHFKFLPGLGFYGFGLTHMIGGLSKASTSILRQLIDAGTLANSPAGS